MKGRDMMKKNLEEMQVKVANKRAILESHDGEEFSPITVAKNVLCEDGTTMQDYFDNHSEPNISTKIVNSNSMSKVGQGDSVDFSDNVMNGAYEDVVLKGKSLVNVIQGSSKDKVVLPYSFEEGERVTINDTHVNGRVEVGVKGRTLVNVHQQTLGEITLPCDKKYRQYNIYVANNPMLMTNRTYLYILDVKKNTANSCALWNNNRNTIGKTSHIGYPIEPGQIGRTVFKVNFKDLEGANNHRYNWLEFVSDLEEYTGEIVFTLNIIEYQEGMENWDIPYFEGMANVQTPTIQTVGKNFKQGIPVGDFTLTNNEYTFTNASNKNGVRFDIDQLLRVGDTVTVSVDCKKNEEFGNGLVLIAFNGEIEVMVKNTPFSIDYERKSLTMTIPQGTTHLLLGLGTSLPRNVSFKNIQMERGGASTTYERYQSSSLTLPEEVILRSLPNGVCDTYNTKTKEYTQRIGEIVLDGVNYKCIKITTNGDETKRFDINFTFEKFVGANSWIDLTKMNASVICDKAICNSNGHSVHPNKNAIASFNGILVLFIEDNTILTIKKANEWLQQKPITVQYELATPIVTEIDLPSLKAYNTITHLSSTVGEGSLVPTLASDHTVDYPVVIKPNTKYSIIANHRRRGDEENPISFNLGGANSTVVPGERVTTITTPSTLTHSELRVSGRETQISDVMVIEGEVNRQVPYFEGIGDCKSPILKSVGKNLFDINGEFTKCSYSMGIPFKPSYDATSKLDVISPNEFVITTPNNSYNDGFGQYIDVSGVDEVTVGVTALFNHSKTNLECKVMFLRVGEAIPTTIKDRDELLYPVTTINVSNGDRAELTLRTRQYARVFIMLSGAWKSEMSGTCSFTIKDVYVGANEEYEPYKSNTTTFTSNDDEIIVLRSLSNGVCDTLNVKTGEYVQRIGEVVFNGSDEEVWYKYSNNTSEYNTTDKTSVFNISVNGKKLGYNTSICDTFKNTGSNKAFDMKYVEPFTYSDHPTLDNCYFDYGSNNNYTLNDFKVYLQQNPITVQYELATPIVKQINVEGYPYSYENGHVLLESDSIEQSLTPTIEYSIVANRGGQIRSNQRTVERHQKKLDSLYAMTLVNMIDSQYRQVLMKLKSELGSEVRTWDIE